MHKLAIIVPAWKATFLRAALDSLRQQSCLDFDCYIFDDAAPAEVANIAKEFQEFHYVRFAENWGGKDLVAHWNRCLATIGHEWVWVFSDDDVAQPNCVKRFYEALASTANTYVFQFEMKMVDEGGTRVLRSSSLPLHETGKNFLLQRLSGSRQSCLPDHIFSWWKLKEIAGGIINFPMAWNSDDATWIALANSGRGIQTVVDATVFWRQSGENISSDFSSQQACNKLSADLQYLQWLNKNSLLKGEYRHLGYQWLAKRWGRLYRFSIFQSLRLSLRIAPTAILYISTIGIWTRINCVLRKKIKQLLKLNSNLR